MVWSVTTQPASEPVTLDEAKLHLRVDVTDDDTLISALIQSAREHVELACERALMPQVWTERLSAFPQLPCWGLGQRIPPNATTIQVRGGLVRAVDSVKYVDTSGTLQTLDPAAYLADLSTQPATLVPAYQTNWPTAREQPGSVKIQYQVGYADADSIPAALKAAVLLLVGDLYANREASVAGQPIMDNPALDRLLVPYKRIAP